VKGSHEPKAESFFAAKVEDSFGTNYLFKCCKRGSLGTGRYILEVVQEF